MADTLFDRIGGLQTVNAVVDLFYDSMAEDASLSKLFDGHDLSRQRLHQKQFLTMVFGGPNNLETDKLLPTDSLIWNDVGKTTQVSVLLQHLREAFDTLALDDQSIEEALAAVSQSDLVEATA